LSNPKLTFASVPELPEDEIISQVLFGKSRSQLSTAEAVQLAASVAELTGQGGGATGILGRVRSTLGVDVLRLESGDDDSTTPDVAAGKYLTEDVYVGAKQGAAADSGTAQVEVEITSRSSPRWAMRARAKSASSSSGTIDATARHRASYALKSRRFRSRRPGCSYRPPWQATSWPTTATPAAATLS
jgi:autotransporter translocation and assembly factor TamB